MLNVKNIPNLLIYGKEGSGKKLILYHILNYTKREKKEIIYINLNLLSITLSLKNKLSLLCEK